MAADRSHWGPAAAEFPFESRVLEVSGQRIHYIDEGNGPPVVFVHGNPTWSFYYRHAITSLRGSRRCIAYDHVGMGWSDKPAAVAYDHTLDRRVDDLSAVLDTLVPEGPLSFVAHDWGGMIALAWAERNRGRVERIALGNTSGFHLPKGRHFHWQLRLARSPLLAPAMRWGNAFAVTAAWTCCRRAGAMTADRRRAYLAPYANAASRHAIERFVADIPLGPADPAFAAVDRVDRWTAAGDLPPILLLWGRHDFVFDDAFLAEWRRRVPSARTVVYEDCGHYIFEDAAKECGEELRRFFGVGEHASAPAADPDTSGTAPAAP